jgi:hypothetical protein
MAKSRRKESQGWFEREGQGIVQRGEPRKTRLEASRSASKDRKRCWKKEVFLCEDEWDAGADEETQR